MKATGIVRRIDDLGRVVIPKEIRRTMRIREGDPLEIFTDKEGEVILKKYSPIGELSDFASQYAETLAKTSGHVICITDKDSVIAVSGAPKKDFFEKRVSGDLEKVMQEKTTFMMKPGEEKKISVVEGGDNKYSVGVVAPIISEGDTIGSVVFLTADPNVHMGEVESKLAQSAAGFLGKQLEQ
ncbi:MAG: AbrB family transcriptional regulator, stage sporulation protein [Petroclostridium sp.]|jgi:AbrB family transcriptional regulator (stage V sporulation protein T)|nr:transcriptional regulator, AbrB family [Clostridia bacterium]MDK2810024.1 AbrB family transcriptional regulator, stage sporulation protein [Petroclostridium sp.]